MTTAVQHFLGNLRRTLSLVGGQPKAQTYKVTAVREPFVDKKIGDCLVLERVGQGAMSVMYKAKQDVTERTVAVKMLRVQLCCDPKNVKRFQREAKAISRLRHPNLLNVYHVGTARTGQPFIVMDFVEGHSLSELIHKEGRIPWQRAVSIFEQVCDAMNHAHDQSVIHRDIKPDNIMLVEAPGKTDSVKVVDFGIVKLTDESQRLSQKLTQTNEIWGSPIYMSPEQISGNVLDMRSDIYSLGTVMYEALTGKLPFSGKNITELVMKQLAADAEPFASVDPALKIPEWLEKTVFKALQKDPSKRFRTMAELQQALRGQMQPALGGTPAGAMAALGSSAPNAVAAGEVSVSGRSKTTKVDDFIGRTLEGGYAVTQFIGEGGMSMVYKAVQNGTDRVVAVKVLRQELCRDDNYVKRFEREAKSLARLAHPGLLSIYDVGTAHTGQAYMVIEYLQGRSLHQWIIDSGKMPVARALPIFIQVCDVMSYAHKQGIIHRDIKPHNIMLINQGRLEDVVKVVDFGIVKLDENIVSVSQKLTASGEICGSPMYMSPEQILDQPLDPRTDVYSFGIVMYEILSGRPLFGGNKITEVMNKHVNVKPQPLPIVVPDSLIPAELDLAIRRCLEKNREVRFENMLELKAELASIEANLDKLTAKAAILKANPALTPSADPAAAGRGVSGGSAPRPGSPSRSAGGRGRQIILVVAVLLLLGSIGAAVMFVMRTPPAAEQPSTSEQTQSPDQHGQSSTKKSSSSPHHRTNKASLHGRHKGAGRNETVEVMDATERAHLEHNAGSASDDYKVMPPR